MRLQWGQEALNPALKSKELNRDTDLFGTKIGIADAMVRQRLLQHLSCRCKPSTADPGAHVQRFAGAVPEVANCRLAMIGVLAAIAGEVVGKKNVFEQIKIAPVRTQPAVPKCGLQQPQPGCSALHVVQLSTCAEPHNTERSSSTSRLHSVRMSTASS